MSEQMDPEDVKAFAHELTGRMGQEVSRFGGTVVSVMGDAIMAVFGAPVTHEDDAERAVRAALAMRDSITAAASGLPFSLHIGVNTGEVMAGLVGPQERREYTVMGDVTNTAARLQSAAPPGTILVGRATHLATQHVIDYEQSEPVSAKGKEEPVEAWRAIGATGGPAERPSSAAPLVGRAAEIELLTRSWEQVVAESTPRLVTVIGPPGIGKSRLVRELTDGVERSGRLIKGRCLPYGETTGYDALGQQVQQTAGILESDPVPLARSKLKRRVRELVAEEESEEVSAHLQILLGLSSEGAPDKQLLFFSVRRFVEGLAREAPTTLAFEDIHWAQPALLDVLESVAARVRDVPLLLLTAARNELLDRRPTWGGGLARYTAITLEPLDDEHSRELARSLLVPGEEASDSIDSLVQTGGGNPLFLEELAASVAERAPGTTSSLPTNVQAIIAARLDALPGEELRVLRQASIVGRLFWRGALAELAGNGSGLDATLDDLELRDLIRRQPGSRLAGDREFMFKHILTQEVAYSAIPKTQRRTGHAAVARYLEAAMGDRARESASALAHHLKEAGDLPRAAGYLMTAAEIASRAWAKEEAVALYTEVLTLIGDSDPDMRAAAALARAMARLDAGDYKRALEDLEPLLPELEGRNRALGLHALEKGWYWLMDTERIHRYGEEAVTAAREIGDEELEARGLTVLAEAAGMDGETSKAIERMGQAVAKWPPDRRDGMYAAALSQGAINHYWRGEYQAAFDQAREGFELGHEFSSIPAVVNGASHAGLALVGMSRTEEALQWLQRAVTFGRETEPVPRFSARALNMWAGCLRELGDLHQARELNEQALEFATRAAFPGAQVSARIDLLFIDILEGEIGRAEATLPELLDAAEKTKGWHQWLWTVRLLEARAEAELAAGRPDEAVDTAQEAVRQTLGPGRVKYACRSRTVMGQALLALGRSQEAVDPFRLAVSDAERLGHGPSLWPALEGLATALAAAGDDGEAEAAHARARRAVEDFAAPLAEERRAALLASPQVVSILGRP
jgi:class 3 adenylate cyclase/tetratricopeptide (TPR) repeat protein